MVLSREQLLSMSVEEIREFFGLAAQFEARHRDLVFRITPLQLPALKVGCPIDECLCADRDERDSQETRVIELVGSESWD